MTTSRKRFVGRNSHVSVGARAEKFIENLYDPYVWDTYRSPGSRGAMDITAVNRYVPVTHLIQVKSSRNKIPHPRKKDEARLRNYAHTHVREQDLLVPVMGLVNLKTKEYALYNAINYNDI